jgi:uncharacterized membrane protein
MNPPGPSIPDPLPPDDADPAPAAAARRRRRAHRAEQLLVVVAAVRLLEYRVPLMGHVAEGMIDGHFPVLGLQMYGLGMGRQLTVVSLLVSLIPFILISKASSVKIQSASLHIQVYSVTEL